MIATMTRETASPIVLSGEVYCPRIKDFEPTSEALAWTLHRDREPMYLSIYCGWQPRKGEWKDRDWYWVSEYEPSRQGRIFLLDRNQAAIEQDAKRQGDVVEQYATVIGFDPKDDCCTCPDWEYLHKRGLPCKHMAVLRELVIAGQLNDEVF